MKRLTKILGMLVVSFLMVTFFASCSRDDDPADNDFFVGTYNGSIGYNADGNTISTDDGSVTVVKIASGTKYNFRFSNDIPDLTGVEFRKEGDNVLVSVDATATQYIRIDNNSLTMLYNKDGKTWTADCTR